MGFGDALGAAVGNPTQAIITIYDKRNPEKETIDETKLQGTQKRALAVNSNMKTAALKNVKVPKTISLANDAEKNSPDWRGAPKRIKVQFNPSEIMIEGQGGGLTQVSNFGAKTEKGSENQKALSYSKVQPRVSVNIPLVFDRENNTDCFSKLDLNLSLTNIAKTAASVIKNEEYTVQPQVEGFLAALYMEKTREVDFSWGTMSYTGILNQINVQYTMFSPSGNPVRAVVSISLLCVDPSISGGDRGDWGEKFKTAFDNIDKKRNTLANKAKGIVNL